MNRAIIIAEAGVNHNGSIQNAKTLIDIAAAAGADLVKFQTFKAESLVTISAPKANPPVRERVNSVNKLIREGNFSCENCPNLIMDFERNVWRGNDIDKRDADQSHASDAIGYGINRLFPARRRVMESVSW